MAKKRRRAVGRPRVLTRENTWQSLYESISDGSLIPIISNAVRLDSLFDLVGAPLAVGVDPTDAALVERAAGLGQQREGVERLVGDQRHHDV